MSAILGSLVHLVQDMLQEGYAMQWGAEGRNDLGRMKAPNFAHCCS